MVSQTESYNNDASNTKVLLIEDNYYIQDIYKNYLKSEGYQVMLCSDGKQGFEQAILIKPDIILLDMMLPVMNGMEVLKKLKENSKTYKIPVVLITNLGQRDIISEAFKLGAQGYLLKVRCDQDTLLRTINIFIKNPEHQMDIKTEAVE